MTGAFCICGGVKDDRGMCLTHCDARGTEPCGDSCPYCRNVRHHCSVCHTRCITIPAAQLHERKCRETENAQMRKKP